MFLILNRLRGMFTWARILISIATGLVSYLFLHDVYLSGLVAIIYFIPLTIGCGCWFSIYDFATRGLNGSTSNQHGSSSWSIV